MQCVNPGHRWVLNPLTGGRTWTPYPCGHCVACLHNAQDSWSIRINETAKFCDQHEFIYDTLTFSPEKLPKVVLPDSCWETASQASRDLFSLYSAEYMRCTGEEAKCVVPYVTREIIRNWIRRARELYVYNHGVRPKWKYVVFMEYGPKTSRPHFHLLFFNISRSVYNDYLANVWKRDYGFVKTFLVRNDTSKGRECISKYISKYCSKGVFDSPLVLESFAPKPFRCISNGIGAEYLQSGFARSFSSEFIEVLKGIKAVPCKDSEFNRSCGYNYSRCSEFYDKNGDEIEARIDSLPLDKLQIYVDEHSFKHACPRYYKSKLLDSSHPNYFHCAVQNILQSRYSEYYKGELFKFALQMGYFNAKREATFLGFSSEQYDALARQFTFASKDKARSEARGRFIRLKNHYLRPTRDKRFAYVS